ncbi:MAG TPA: hypothetical protein VIH61_05680, partial [Waddliaceae bacterium]
YLRPLLIQIENTVRNLQESEDANTEVLNAVRAALDPKPRNGSDRRLGTLALNAITQLGTLGNVRTTSKAISFATLGAVNLEQNLVGIVSDLATLGLQDFRESPHLFVDAIVPLIKNKFKAWNKEVSLEVPKTDEEADAAMKAEISKISRLAYDLLFYSVDGFENKEAVKTALKKGITLFIGSDPSRLEQSIADVYQKLVGNALVNENLAIRCQEVIFAAMTEASETIAKRSKPMTLASVPRLIPSFV